MFKMLSKITYCAYEHIFCLIVRYMPKHFFKILTVQTFINERNIYYNPWYKNNVNAQNLIWCYKYFLKYDRVFLAWLNVMYFVLNLFNLILLVISYEISKTIFHRFKTIRNSNLFKFNANLKKKKTLHLIII